MTITTKQLVTHLDEFLNCQFINDYCPNGLQVEGRAEIKKIVTGVTASQALINAAIAADADALITHHGYFWKGEQPQIVGIKRSRVQTLLQADLNLLSYHLPLDVHKTLGNNAQLGALLNLVVTDTHSVDGIKHLVWQGECQEVFSAADFAAHLTTTLNREPLHIEGSSKPIKTVAWCTGGAERYIEKAVELGVDAYITGEVSEQTFHIAKEAGIHFFAAGHHATERYGIKALGDYLEKTYGITHQFIDIDNPI